ncbi:MAG TPA: MliC family protein [Gammaproteobacteria bacterium]|nr:MliC family protein [Gammaproteobacteria bacterium]
MPRRHAALAAALASLLAACATPPPPPPPPPAPVVTAPPPAPAAKATTYSGTLDYPMRIALPPDTTALVEVLDSRSETPIAIARYTLDGRQVPLPFTIDVPAAEAGAARVLRASFVVKGRKRWRSQTLPISATKTELGTIALGPIAPPVDQYRCGETLVGLGPREDGHADLVLPSRRLMLTQVPSASGAKYVQADDAGTWFWRKGTHASVAIEGAALPACTRVGAEREAP